MSEAAGQVPQTVYPLLKEIVDDGFAVTNFSRLKNWPRWDILARWNGEAASANCKWTSH